MVMENWETQGNFLTMLGKFKENCFRSSLCLGPVIYIKKKTGESAQNKLDQFFLGKFLIFCKMFTKVVENLASHQHAEVLPNSV